VYSCVFSCGSFHPLLHWALYVAVSLTLPGPTETGSTGPCGPRPSPRHTDTQGDLLNTVPQDASGRRHQYWRSGYLHREVLWCRGTWYIDTCEMTWLELKAGVNLTIHPPPGCLSQPLPLVQTSLCNQQWDTGSPVSCRPWSCRLFLGLPLFSVLQFIPACVSGFVK